MPSFLLRPVIWADVALAVALIVALWRLFHSGSGKTRKIVVASVIGVALLIIGYAVARRQMRKSYSGHWEEQLETVAAFVETNREQIEQFAGRLDAIRSMVERDGWLPEGERTYQAADPPAMVIWTHQLRGEDAQGFDDSYSEFWDIEDLVDWARHPEQIANSYDGQLVDDLTRLLDLAAAPYVVIGVIDNVVRPETTNVEFGQDGSVSGELNPGSTSFGVAVVELQTGKIAAHGRGEATSGDEVRITASTDMLMADLWGRMHKAALELGRQLLRGSE